MTVGDSAVKHSYGYQVVQIVSVTDKQVRYSTGTYEGRVSKGTILFSHADEAVADRVCSQLVSANAECNSRRRAASEWLNAETAKIVAAASA